MNGTGHAGIHRTHAGAHLVAARQHTGQAAAVTVFAMFVRSNDRHSMGLLRQFWKSAADGDAGNRSRHLTRHAAVFGWSSHLRVERFNVRSAARQAQYDDRLIGDRASDCRGLGASREQTRQRQTTHPQRSSLDEIAACESFAIPTATLCEKGQHGVASFGGIGGFVKTDNVAVDRLSPFQPLQMINKQTLIDQAVL